ncbi:MAG: phosphoribosylanthranilate isomerase, partial [Planctomycetota bacterium]
KSPRCVDTKLAQQLSARAEQFGIQVAAIVMDPAADFLAELIDSVPLHFVQLHGSENLDILKVCGNLPIIKALSWSGRAEESRLAREWSSVGSQLHALLVDAYAPNEGGGTGRVADWEALFPRPEEMQQSPMWLAGGLRPDNVGASILATRCEGVDTASGVESAPGRKEPDAVREFALQARAAFQEIANDA